MSLLSHQRKQQMKSDTPLSYGRNTRRHLVISNSLQTNSNNMQKNIGTK